jgi:hypothetical protein
MHLDLTLAPENCIIIFEENASLLLALVASDYNADLLSSTRRTGETNITSKPE